MKTRVNFVKTFFLDILEKKGFEIMKLKKK